MDQANRLARYLDAARRDAEHERRHLGDIWDEFNDYSPVTGARNCIIWAHENREDDELRADIIY